MENPVKKVILHRNKLTFIVSLTVICFLHFNSVVGQCKPKFQIKETIYENPLSGSKNIEDFVIESSKNDQPKITFNNGKMKLSSDVHFLMWFPDDFPDDIAVSWDFLPHNDNGLAMFWFCAKGKDGEDLFDNSLNERTGQYPQYHSGDINAYHVSYFRRNPWDDPYINTVNLRKSYGNEMVAFGPNPIPNVNSEKVKKSIKQPYRIMVIKCGKFIRVKINDMVVIDLTDNNPYLNGKIGFRQMANLVAEYSNLKVRRVELID